MTRDKLVKFLDTIYRNIVDRVEPESKDAYQRAAVRLLDHYEEYECETEAEFKSLIHSHARMLLRRDNSDEMRKQNSADFRQRFWQWGNNGDDESDVGEWDPPMDESSRRMLQRALEYIELLPLVYRRIFIAIFIEGKSEQDVAIEAGVSPRRLYSLVQEGVQWIKDELKMLGE